MSTTHTYIEGQARSIGTRYSRHETCQKCGLTHHWGGDMATGEERHSYRPRLKYDELGMLIWAPEAMTEPPCHA